MRQLLILLKELADQSCPLRRPVSVRERRELHEYVVVKSY
jgi:hypothetical protein